MSTRRKTDKRSSVRDITYIAFSTAVLVLCSWLRLPFVIPITMQSFGVFIAMGLLGGKRSFFAVLLYLLLGCIGLPVFAGFAGGIGYLLGSTGGYIFGFLLPPLFLWLCEKVLPNCKYIFIVCAVIGLLGCYAIGTIWYAFVYAQSSDINILSLCVTPFVLPDLLKLLTAHLIYTRLKNHISL